MTILTAIATGACATGRAVTVEPVALPCATAGSGVTWFSPSDPLDRRRLTNWCESIGPPEIIRGLPEARGSKPRSNLIVATWNVHEDAGRIDEFLDSFGSADVVLLVQEAVRRGNAIPPTVPVGIRVPRRQHSVDEDGDPPDIIDVARARGLWAVYIPSMRNGRVQEDRGCAILSTLPLSDPAAIELPWVKQRRVAAAATVHASIADQPIAITVVTTHLDNRPGRKIQSAALAEWVKVRLKPVIIGGDLNAWFGAREDTVRQIDAVVARVKDCRGGPTARLRRRLDFLFASPLPGAEHSCEVIRSTFGSDHHPVVLRYPASSASSGGSPPHPDRPSPAR